MGPETLYSFCEGVWAAGKNKWHLRKLTEAGQKLGGAIDTPSLCGTIEVGGGWDVGVDLTSYHLEHNCCKKCKEIHDEQKVLPNRGG